MTGLQPSDFAKRLDQTAEDTEVLLGKLLSDEVLSGEIFRPKRLVDAMRYSSLNGGKRLRPFLVVESAAVFGVARRAALLAGAALECIHCYSLIHDDLPAMDDDTLRRGRPTSHVVFGEGLAVLAGDGLLTEAFGLIAREPAGIEPWLVGRKLETIALVASAAGALGMVGGQAVDLAAAAGYDAWAGMSAAGRHAANAPALRLDATQLETMHAMKTGALIRAAATAGAIMAGAPEPARTAVAEYAANLGLAFQIVDDVLDVEGAAATLGKTAGKDAAAGKPTYPALFGLDASKALARQAVERALAALDRAGLSGHLGAIARSVVDRTS